MQKRAWILLSVGALALHGCVAPLERAEVVESKTHGFEGIRRLRVETKNGSVELKGDETATDLHLRATKFARGHTEEEARRGAESIEIELSRESPASDLLLVVVHVPEELRRRSAGANLDIALPAACDLEIRTSNGRVGVAGIEGNVDVKTSNGKIDISSVTGNVSSRTSNGVVTLRDVTGDAALESSNGKLSLERVEAETITATTSNGRIEGREVSGAPTLKTSNGTIDWRAVSLPESPHIKARTSNGRIYMELPASVNAALELRASNGRIRKKLENVAVTGLEQSKKLVRATLNGGGGNIELSTSNGEVRFETR